MANAILNFHFDFPHTSHITKRYTFTLFNCKLQGDINCGASSQAELFPLKFPLLSSLLEQKVTLFFDMFFVTAV